MFFENLFRWCYETHIPRNKGETFEDYYDRVSTDIDELELKSLQHVLHTPSCSTITVVLEGSFAETDKKFLSRRYSDLNIVIKKTTPIIVKEPFVHREQLIDSIVDFDQDYRHLGETLLQYMNRVITLLDDEDQIIDIYIDEEEDVMIIVTTNSDPTKRHYLQSRFSNCKVVYHNV